MMRASAADHQRAFLAVLVVLIGLAWVALWMWSASPAGRYLGHSGAGLPHGAASPGPTMVALLFVLGWTVMTVAMMLPTSLPLVLLFRRVVDHRADAPMLVGLVIAGYLAVWGGFGVLAHLLDLGIHELVDHRGWLRGSSWVLAVAPLLVAGVYQFTPLKTICLKRCRSPLSFVTGHWHGLHPRAEAAWLGLHHGLFCVGCCWSLMLVMFAVGVGQVAWMLALAVVMAVEKNVPWGRLLSAPLGAALLVLGLGLAIFELSAGSGIPGLR
jgi:predicted metal-binding membrane protein